jgi:hypothetical protein
MRSEFVATTAAEALDGVAIDLPEGVLAGILAELVSLDGRLDLALDRLADALDPVACDRLAAPCLEPLACACPNRHQQNGLRLPHLILKLSCGRWRRSSVKNGTPL